MPPSMWPVDVHGNIDRHTSDWKLVTCEQCLALYAAYAAAAAADAVARVKQADKFLRAAPMMEA